MKKDALVNMLCLCNGRVLTWSSFVSQGYEKSWLNMMEDLFVVFSSSHSRLIFEKHIKLILNRIPILPVVFLSNFFNAEGYDFISYILLNLFMVWNRFILPYFLLKKNFCVMLHSYLLKSTFWRNYYQKNIKKVINECFLFRWYCSCECSDTQFNCSILLLGWDQRYYKVRHATCSSSFGYSTCKSHQGMRVYMLLISRLCLCSKYS